MELSLFPATVKIIPASVKSSVATVVYIFPFERWMFAAPFVELMRL